MALQLVELNAFTTNDVVPKTTDTLFKQSPLWVRLLNRRNVKFEGGLAIQRPIMYAELNGGAFGQGDTFDTAYVKTDTAFVVNMKFYYVGVTLYGTDDVLNRGRNTAFSQVETKFANASLTMAKILAKAMYSDGQSSDSQVSGATGSTPFSNTKNIDGLLAWIDDGNSGSGNYSTATDETRSFLSIGGITRSDMFAAAPSFGAASATPLAAVQGANAFTERAFTDFSLAQINKAYGFAWYGNDFPDMLVTGQNGFNRVWNATQPNQRYMDQNADTAKVGFQTFRFNASELVVDKYAPDKLMLGLNTNYIELYLTQNQKFQLGFTGFKEAQNSIDLTGQFLFAGNLVCPNPRTSFKLIGSALG